MSQVGDESNQAARAALLACREAARLLSRRLDGELSPAEAAALEEHLYACLACRRVDAQLLFLRRLARRYAEGGA
jgi:anti-sigma factor RsiW